MRDFVVTGRSTTDRRVSLVGTEERTAGLDVPHSHKAILSSRHDAIAVSSPNRRVDTNKP